ncbi:MAG TPA: hypothetical protein VMN60_11925 [Longimicrobiales bacterium]|nr:hypothetical protein [Longimicrobiales bacterium]
MIRFFRISCAASLCAASLVFSACLGEIELLSPDLPECRSPQLDTSTWTRVEDRVVYEFSAAVVSFLLPPGFQKIGAHTWERGGTRLHWAPFVADRIDRPFPELVYSGSCRTSIAGARAVFDYGGLAAGPTPDAAVIATWRTIGFVGTSGTLIFDARMIDHSDMRLIEQLLFSLVVPRGPMGAE